MDCAALAAMGALKHFRKPEVEVLGDEVIIVCHLLDHVGRSRSVAP